VLRKKKKEEEKEKEDAACMARSSAVSFPLSTSAISHRAVSLL
jgi:hypothetical protein